MITYKERLDFLIKYEAHVGWRRDGDYCSVYKSDYEDGFVCMNANYKFFADPRQAIDAAIIHNKE